MFRTGIKTHTHAHRCRRARRPTKEQANDSRSWYNKGSTPAKTADKHTNTVARARNLAQVKKTQYDPPNWRPNAPKLRQPPRTELSDRQNARHGHAFAGGTGARELAVPKTLDAMRGTGGRRPALALGHEDD